MATKPKSRFKLDSAHLLYMPKEMRLALKYELLKADYKLTHQNLNELILEILNSKLEFKD